MRIGRLFNRRKYDRWAVDRLHQSIISQSLRPEFYTDGGVRDTFGGRFEVTTLNGVLVLRRLRELGAPGRDLAQECFDALFDGFDDALREIGTGDLVVGKKIRKMGEAFYGRARAYDEALADGAEPMALEQAVARNISLDDAHAARMADYVRTMDDRMARHTEAGLLKGEVAWLKPSFAS